MIRTVILTSCAAITLSVCAADDSVRFTDSGTDRIRLRGGTTIEGVVVSSRPDGLWIAVERSWLENERPQLAKTWLDDAEQAETARRQRMVTRIDAWMMQRQGWDSLQEFLKSERARLGKSPPPTYQFILRKLDPRQVQSVRTQDASRRQIYFAAWVRGMHDVCRQTTHALQARMAKEKVDPSSIGIEEWVTLLPPKPDSDVEWRVRQALVEWQYGERLAFQGTKDFWLPVDAQGQVQLGAQGGSLQELLATLLGGAQRSSNMKSAVKQANAMGVRSFLVKELQTGANGIPRAVSERLYAQTGQTDWQPVISQNVTAKAGDAEAARELGQDPQVKEVLSLAKSLGLPLGAGQLQAALGAGVGVQQAMRDANARTTAQLQLYARSLDPPLWWPR